MTYFMLTQIYLIIGMSYKHKSSSVKSNGSSVKGSVGYGGSADVTGVKAIVPLHYGGLGFRFFEQLCIEPDKILQVDTINNVTETKGSVKARATQLATEMQARGIGYNDIILISSKTHAHQTIVLLATLFLGAIVCPVNPESPFKECLELVKKLKPKMCFCDCRTVSQISRIILNLNMTLEIVSFGSEVTDTTQFCKLFPFKEDVNFKPFFINNPHKEVAFIVPTQGTCDDPKLVCISHHNLFLQCINFMETFDNPSKVISFFPLSWVIQTILACTSLEFGVTRIMAASFNERTACKMIHDFVIDMAVLGTDLAMRLMGNVAVKDYNLNCLKCVLVGVINTSKEQLQSMRNTLPNVKFQQVYSLTETGFVSTVPASHYEYNSVALEKPCSVGKVVKNCKIKIIDENHKHVEPNQVGELYFYGDGLMLGYFKDKTSTLEALEKGYFRTGDLARYDKDGWIYLDGRIDDVIFYNNSSFIPVDIDDCLCSHPQVHDAFLIGNNDTLVACIQTKPESKLTEDNIRMYFMKKMPECDKEIDRFVFFEEFPRTNAGHIKKRLLRDQILKVTIEYTRSLASISPSNIDEIQQNSSTK